MPWPPGSHSGFLDGIGGRVSFSYQVTLHDDTTIVGTRVGESPTELKLALPSGQVATLQKSNIKHTQALPDSLMPAGLLATLTEAEIKDLMTFLLTAQPRAR